MTNSDHTDWNKRCAANSTLTLKPQALAEGAFADSWLFVINSRPPTCKSTSESLGVFSKEIVMSPAVDECKEAMREAVCSVCVSFATEGLNPSRCVHEDSGQCSLFAHLDDVVDVVSNVDSGSIVPYLEALRHNVCAKCKHQNKLGFCDIRDNRGPTPTWCALDAYFNLVVGAVENVRKQHAEAMSSVRA
jgi:hypothetical protein